MSATNNINAVVRELNDVFKRFELDSEDILKGTAQHIYDKSQHGADSHRITGALSDSVFLRSVSGGYQVGINEQIAPHAKFVHFGTKAHVIKPNNKKSLRWAANGRFNFSKKGVNHPGYKGDPFFYDAIDSGIKFFTHSVNNIELR